MIKEWKTREEKEAIVADMQAQGYEITQSASFGKKHDSGGVLIFEEKKPDITDMLRRIEALEAKAKQ